MMVRTPEDMEVMLTERIFLSCLRSPGCFFMRIRVNRAPPWSGWERTLCTVYIGFVMAGPYVVDAAVDGIQRHKNN